MRGFRLNVSRPLAQLNVSAYFHYRRFGQFQELPVVSFDPASISFGDVQDHACDGLIDLPKPATRKLRTTRQSMKPFHEQQAALVSFQPFMGKKAALLQLVMCRFLMELVAFPGAPQAKQHLHHFAQSFLFP